MNLHSCVYLHHWIKKDYPMSQINTVVPCRGNIDIYITSNWNCYICYKDFAKKITKTFSPVATTNASFQFILNFLFKCFRTTSNE